MPVRHLGSLRLCVAIVVIMAVVQLMEQIAACDKLIGSAPADGVDSAKSMDALANSLVLSIRRIKLVPSEVQMLHARIATSLFSEDRWHHPN